MERKLGVVTVLFNSSAVLPAFFDSLDCQEFRAFHVWAVDNASIDDSAALCRRLGDQVSVIANPENRGVAAANNQGISAAREAGCDRVLLVNNDVEFGPRLFTQLIEGLARNDCQMTAPMMYYFDRPGVIWSAGGRYQPLLGYRCLHLYDGVVDAGQFPAPFRAQHAPTCCVLFDCSVFNRVGNMDERYFVYHDDTDFMLRCWKAGERLYILPEAKLLHKVSSLTGGAESRFSVEMGTRNRAYMLAKFLGRFLAVPYVAGLSLVYLLRRLRGRDNGERHSLKQSSLRAGFRMARNWLPLAGTAPGSGLR
jgi:GT2 family glycosyltransferase